MFACLHAYVAGIDIFPRFREGMVGPTGTDDLGAARHCLPFCDLWFMVSAANQAPSSLHTKSAFAEEAVSGSRKLRPLR